MKRIFILVFMLSGACFFLACFETTSETTILKNGSGTVVVYVDMSKLFDIVQATGVDLMEELDGDKIIDSIIYFKNNISQIEKHKGTPLTADEKEMYENTKMHTKASVREKTMNFTMTTKFSKISQLPITIDLLSEAMSQSPMGRNDSGEVARDSIINEVTGNPNDGMSYIAKDGLIEFAFDEKKYTKAEAAKNISQNLEMMKGMIGGGMPVKMIFNLPRPSKSVSGKAKIEVSTDKKRVTISYDIIDTFKDPSVQTFRIVY